MQTFLLSTSPSATARLLDNRRLGKQRVEAMQILQTLCQVANNPTAKVPWSSHPATIMWKNNLSDLALYTMTMCEEWKRRGFADSVEESIKHITQRHPTLFAPPTSKPWWIRDTTVISALCWTHVVSLCRKDYAFYRPRLVNDSMSNVILGHQIATCPYFWPRSDKSLWILNETEHRRVTDKEVEDAANNYNTYFHGHNFLATQDTV